jgi:PAS domain S-box-containing protein
MSSFVPVAADFENAVLGLAEASQLLAHRYFLGAGVFASLGIAVLLIGRWARSPLVQSFQSVLVALFAFIAITDVVVSTFLLLPAPENATNLSLSNVLGCLSVGLVFALVLLMRCRTQRKIGELSERVSAEHRRVEEALADKERIKSEASAHIEAASLQIRRLASVVESSPHPIIGFYRDGTVWQWGAAAQELLGISSSEALCSHADRGPEALKILWKEVQRLDMQPSSNKRSELELPVAPGGNRIVWMNLAPLPALEGSPQGWSVHLRDVTDRVHLDRKVAEQLLEKKALLKEVHHRVKNNLQLICSLLRLQSREVPDISTLPMFRKSEERIRSLALVHEKLYQADSLSEIPFGEYLSDLTSQLVNSSMIDQGTVQIERFIEEVAFSIDAAISAGLIANELISNSLKHARRVATQPLAISVTLRKDGNSVLLGISDNGLGIQDDTAFDSPKTLGLKLIKSLTTQLRGTLTCEVNQGTHVRISMPLATLEAQNEPTARAAA